MGGVKKPKLLLIGWDAADWNVINPLLKAGKMPALQRLINSGAHGNIATLNPVLSPMLWTSIATGKRAYDHGIHGFVEADKATGEISPVKATSRKAKPMWSILNEAGFKTNIVNWWPSHPAEKVNGVCVSNHYHKSAPVYGEDWALDEASIFPKEYHETLKNIRLHPAELTLAHVMPFIPAAAELDPEHDEVLKPFLRVMAHCCSIHNAATYLIEETDWDFMGVYFEAIDHFSHLAMKYHPPKLPEISDEDFEKYKGIVDGAYIFHDMMLERMLDLAGKDCNVMIVSDHGFESGDLRQVELPDVEAAPALEHRQFGVFVAAGPDIIPGEIYGASLLDVTPTVLHHFGLPVGEDMEGQVLHSIFGKNEVAGEIPSWEDTSARPEFVEEEVDSSREILDQLQELGYINLDQSDKLKYVDSELTYNLCVSYLDGNKPQKAKKILEPYFEQNGELRYGMLLAQSYLKLGDLSSLSSHLDIMEKTFAGQGGVHFLRGMLYLQQSDHEKALQHFFDMESRGLRSSQLFNEIGRTFLITQNYRAAKEYFNKTLALDGENTMALSGKAQCALEEARPEDAFLLAEGSLSLQFFQPNTHYILAQASLALGKDDVAKKAVRICLSQAPKHGPALQLIDKLENRKSANQNDEIVVVSGFPRSGTSMMMNMLQKGGVSLFVDDERQRDESNPEGYFEHELVKNLGRENDWMPKARGRAIKVINLLLRYLPSTEVYKVIWVKRPLTEVLLSQEVMLGRDKEEVMQNFPFQKAVDMQKEEERVKNWLEMQANIKMLEVDYYDCITNTNLVIREIEDFLGMDLDGQNAHTAINKKLHRNKLGNY